MFTDYVELIRQWSVYLNGILPSDFRIEDILLIESELHQIFKLARTYGWPQKDMLKHALTQASSLSYKIKQSGSLDVFSEEFFNTFENLRITLELLADSE